jgi:NitT/TauT family transport system permease protein
VSIPLALAVAYSRFVETAIYPVVGVPADHPEDRDRAAVHHLVRLRLHAQTASRCSAVVLSIVVASIAGFKSVDPEIMDFARTTGAGEWKMFFKIRLPQALPDIFTGLKVGAALSATAAVVAEFVASDRGLGYLLLQYNGNLETPMVFAIVVLLSLIGLAIYYTVEIIERITIPWHVSQQPTDVTIT